MNIIAEYDNGNTHVSLFDDGTKIRETNDDEFSPAFAENMDIKICNRCNMNCQFCHENSTYDGKLADIMNEKFINTLHPYQEVALGGGNVLEHPDLVSFLEKLRSLKVIPNITLNQKHFEDNIELVDDLINRQLIFGLGVSLNKPSDEFVSKIKKYPNAVIHVINGIAKPSDIKFLANKGLKILILGYKVLRRGAIWLNERNDEIKENQKWLSTNLFLLLSKFKVVSFDNLAIEQLQIKEKIDNNIWNQFYAGDDGSHTYYIDMVERKFAKSSTADFDKRYELMDSVDDMFKKIVSE